MKNVLTTATASIQRVTLPAQSTTPTVVTVPGLNAPRRATQLYMLPDGSLATREGYLSYDRQQTSAEKNSL